MKSSFSRIIQGCMNWGVWGKSVESTSQMEELIHFNLRKRNKHHLIMLIFMEIILLKMSLAKAFKNS